MAKKDWHLTPDQVEAVVRAAVTDGGTYGAGRVVVADLMTYTPPDNNTVYTEMVIVGDGRSGKVLFSYPAEPQPEFRCMRWSSAVPWSLS